MTMVFEFDRYHKGDLMAEGVKITQQSDLPSAIKAAVRLVESGDVLVLRAPEAPSDAVCRQIDDTARNGDAWLVWWPTVKLDDDGNATDEVTGGSWLISVYQGAWVEPDCLNAIGDHFGDDEEYAAEPTHYRPLPPPPAPGRADGREVMEPARNRFSIGDRVVYSLKGLEWLNPRRPESQGKIVGFSASPYSVRVLWDHRKTPQGLHMDFVEHLTRPSAVA